MGAMNTPDSMAYKEHERKHAYGVFSGCPCQVQFDAPWQNEKPKRVHPEYVEELKRRCSRYRQKDGVTYSNWNRRVKRFYGEWQHYTCVNVDIGNICRMSLKQEKVPAGEPLPIEDECLNCKVFNTSASHRFRCAIKGMCPGIDWTEEQKRITIENGPGLLWREEIKLPEDFDPNEIELFESKTRYEILKDRENPSS